MNLDISPGDRVQSWTGLNYRTGTVVENNGTTTIVAWDGYGSPGPGRSSISTRLLTRIPVSFRVI